MLSRRETEGESFAAEHFGEGRGPQEHDKG